MKRVLSMILALTMLFAAFALTSCANTEVTTTKAPLASIQGSGTQGTTASTGIADINDPNAEGAIRPGYENVSFDGHTFTFATPLNTTDGWADYEVYAEEDGAGILDAGIVARNNVIRQHYDCSIMAVDIENGTLQDDFNTNQNRIDLVLTRYNMGGKANGDYYNFHDLNIDLKGKPWFDQNFIEDVTVNGQLYALVGAFSLTSFDATWVMFFNKKVKETTTQIRDIDFYQLVYDGKWTLDKFFEILKFAAHDDGDSVMTVNTEDIFGLVSSTFGIRGLYFGAGQSYVNKDDSKDVTEFSHAFDQAAVEATNKIIDIYGFMGTTVTDYVKVEAQMRSNTVLFSPEVLRKASYYAGKQGSSTDPVQIGILPHPKLNAEQNFYKHNVDNHVIYMCVPKTCSDLSRIAKFLELYAYHSYYTVYKQYLNLYKYNYTTDTDSATMVDEILKSRCFDLAYQYGWGSVDGAYLDGVANGDNVVSELQGSLGGAIVDAANTYRDKLPGNK